ncbi:MAG: hypothetical protein LW807_05335 [Proteobacteria bacterium]|nr:hypothetical protein [Pseudomonadota bacterium]
MHRFRVKHGITTVDFTIISKVTQPSICDPIKGVKSGNRLTITFNKDSMNMMY